MSQQENQREADGSNQPAADQPAAAPQHSVAGRSAASHSADGYQTVPPVPHGAAWQQPQPQAVPFAGQAWQQPYAQPTMYASVPPQRKSKAWVVALVAIVLVFVLIAMGMRSCTQLFASSMGVAGSGASAADLLTQDAVAVITIEGTIQYDGSSSSPDGLKEMLDEAESNPHIKAVVLRVDSGGGVATAGEEMTVYLRDFSKPVVVSSASTNASAAYEISSQADYIYVAQSTAIGSIGVALQIMDMSGLMEMLGINIENVTSSPSKDSSYGNRALTDEERAHYQHQVDQINDLFIRNVAEGRGMSEDEVRALANGMTYTGVDAVENGLADEIGTKEDALAKAAELAGLSAYAVVDLQPEGADQLSMMLDLLSSDNSSSEDAAVEALKELGNGIEQR